MVVQPSGRRKPRPSARARPGRSLSPILNTTCTRNRPLRKQRLRRRSPSTPARSTRRWSSKGPLPAPCAAWPWNRNRLRPKPEMRGNCATCRAASGSVCCWLFRWCSWRWGQCSGLPLERLASAPTLTWFELLQGDCSNRARRRFMGYHYHPLSAHNQPGTGSLTEPYAR